MLQGRGYYKCLKVIRGVRLCSYVTGWLENVLVKVEQGLEIGLWVEVSMFEMGDNIRLPGDVQHFEVADGQVLIMCGGSDLPLVSCRSWGFQ